MKKNAVFASSSVAFYAAALLLPIVYCKLLLVELEDDIGEGSQAMPGSKTSKGYTG